MPPTTATAIQVLMSYLEGEGVEYVFGIPGGPLMPLYEAIFDRGRMQPIITKHEEGAAFMADGYARVRGGLGVCCTTTGPGATNALTGVACARLDSIPVMLITAQIAIGAFGKGAAQESSVHGIDVVDLYKSATKGSLMVPSAEKLPDTARMLLRKALTGRTGPVHLNLPADLMKRPIPAPRSAPRFYRAEEHCFDRHAIRRACELLAQAKKPAILAGHGVYLSRAFRELRQVAEQLRIPVATTPKGKGVFPEDHLLSLGVFGFAGSPQSESYLLSGEVDVLLAVGTSLGELATHCWSPGLQPRQALIHIDLDPSEIGKNYPVSVGICGDAGTVLTEMHFQLEREMRWRRGADLNLRELALSTHKLEHPRCVRSEGFEDLSTPLKPQRLMRELEQAMPRDAIVFVDIGNVMAWAIHFLKITEPGSFHINLGLGSMGHAVAASIGGKLAAPDRPVIAIVGDAAFLMNGMEVHTAVENNVPVVWVVMNNGGHGMVCHGERLQFKGKFNTGKFRYPVNIAALAAAMGAQALRVEEPNTFAGALDKALRSGRPTVIDVVIDPESMPPLALRIETLDRFFEGGADATKPSSHASAPVAVVTDAKPLRPRRDVLPVSVAAPAGGNGNGSGNGAH